MRPTAELAARIGRQLLSVSGSSRSVRTWNPSVELTLHRLGIRESLSPSLVARVIDSFLSNHHSLALGFFDWAGQQPGYSHDAASYHSIFKSLSISRQFSAMDALFKRVKSQKIVLESGAYQSLIESLVLGGKMQSAFWVFDEAVSIGREIHPNACNRLLAALASNGYSDSAHKLFVKMRQKGIALNTLGFGVYIWKSCPIADTAQLLRLVDEVKKLNLTINGSIVALLLVHGLCNSSREMDAFYMLDELRNINCKPDFMAYRIVAETFVLTGNLYERQLVLKKKRKLGVAPRSSDYREFILDLILSKRITEAKELAEVIMDGNFPIDDDVLEALIKSVSSIDPESAVRFLEFMAGNGRLPRAATLSKLSKNLCRHNKSDDLIKVYELLGSKDYFSDIEDYNMMVMFLCEAGRVREAYKGLHEMKKKGFDPDVMLYNALIEGCCRADLIRPAKKLWDEMFVNGCEMNLTTYNVLIGKLSGEGEADECVRLFQHMVEKGIKADESTYTSLIQCLCQVSRVVDAVAVYQKCSQQDRAVSARVLTAFVLSLCRNGRYREASEVLLREEEGGGHAVLLKCVAEANEVEIGMEHIGKVKEAMPWLLQPVSSHLLASVCSSSNPDSVLPFVRALHHTSTLQP